MKAGTPNVLIVKNIKSEGPGTIEDYLRESGCAYRVIDLQRGEPVPDTDAFSHLIVMGGPMAVYEMDMHPFLRREAALIEQAIKAGRRILGVCLGAQMLAHVLGARVYPGPRKETGWHEVAVTDEGVKDPAMSGLLLDGRKAALVFQWHGDTFDLPPNAVRLAASDFYPNQAFRYADGVYGLQFHIEVTPDIVKEWFRGEKDAEMLVFETERVFTPYHERAKRFYREFFQPR